MRWLEGKLNHRNKTTNRVIEFNGESKCLSEWAELLGISRITLSSRLERGWTIEETLTTPVVKDSTKRVAKKKSERQKLPEYKIWHNMKSRCKSSKNYTDKRISFCPEWESFDVFLQYLKDTIGLRPSDEFKFDRINTLGNYEPGNVRWVTHTENMRNTTTNRLITYKNKTQSVAAWAEEIRIAQTTLLRRLDYWSVEDAIERPVNIRKNKSGKSISPNSCTTDYSSNNK